MYQDIEQILISSAEIGAKVRDLGAAISRDYASKDLAIVAVLKGAAIFLADISRAITVPVTFDFMAVSSYGSSTRSSGVVRILKDLDESVEGRDVLVVEDIVDTGLTLNYLLDNLSSRNPASLEVCALLDKASRRQVPVGLKYVGFSIPDAFVVGYGLDYQDRYRNLPDICVLKSYGK